MNVKGPCKRTQHCWPTTPNIIGPNNVVTCCVRLHGTATILALVAYSLKSVKLLGPCKRTQHCWPQTPNNTRQCELLGQFAWALRLMQTDATSHNIVGPNNVGSCWHLLALVAWCMQTNATTVNIVGVSSLFWP